MGGMLIILRESLPEESQALKDRLSLVMRVEKIKVYVNEIVPLAVKLYIHGLSLKDVQYPQVIHESFSIEEFENPIQTKEIVNGLPFDCIEFKTRLFAKRPGNYKLGPAQLQCQIQIRRDGENPRDIYFGTLENQSLLLKSEEISLTAAPLPDKGRPSGFTGAIGNFHFMMEAHPGETKLGEPISLRMKIEGRGNLNTVTPPKIGEAGFKVYEPQMRQEGNLKIFEYVLIPLSEAVNKIPEVPFSFFDPEGERYHTVYGGPIPIKVKKSEREEDPKVGRDIINIKESPGRLKKKGDYLYKNKTFLLLQLLPILISVTAVFLHKRMERIRTDLNYVRQRKAKKRAKRGLQEAEKILRDGKSGEFYDSVFKTLQEYLGNKFFIPPGGITGEVVDKILKPKGIDKNVLKSLKDIFMECDLARYASLESGETERKEMFLKMKEILSYLERQK